MYLTIESIYYLIAIVSIACGAAYKLDNCTGSALHMPALRDFVATLRARSYIQQFRKQAFPIASILTLPVQKK